MTPQDQTKKYNRLVELGNNINQYPYDENEQSEYLNLYKELRDSGMTADEIGGSYPSPEDFTTYLAAKQRAIPRKNNGASTQMPPQVSAASLAQPAPQQLTQKQEPPLQPSKVKVATQKTTQPPQPVSQAGAENPTPHYKSEADIDARLTQMLIDEAKADKEEDEKRLHRQMAARSLSDMGGVFSDMIKASQGAHVSPRDAEKHYQRLDDNMRKAYDLYRTRMDLLRRQQADRDKARAAQAAADARAKAQREFQADEAEKARKAREAEAERDRKARLRIASITHNYGGGNRKPEDEYFIDFGNGETKDYKENTKEGRNVFAAICQYLLSNNLIPEDALMDKDGNILPVKNQAQADLLVRMYLPSAMEDPHVKSAIYKIVMGRDKDFRDPLTRSIEGQRQPQQGRPAWDMTTPPPAGATQQNRTTSSGSLY